VFGSIVAAIIRSVLAPFTALLSDPRLFFTIVVSGFFVASIGWGAYEQRQYHKTLERAEKAQRMVTSLLTDIQKVNEEAAAHKAAVETGQQEISNDEEGEIRGRLAAALKRLHDHPTGEGCALPSVVPEAAQSASGAAGAGAAAVVDDAKACTSAVIKAEGWQEWYAKQTALSAASH
jgi:hypothetical protein